MTTRREFTCPVRDRPFLTSIVDIPHPPSPSPHERLSSAPGFRRATSACFDFPNVVGVGLRSISLVHPRHSGLPGKRQPSWRCFLRLVLLEGERGAASEAGRSNVLFGYLVCDGPRALAAVSLSV